AAVSEPVTIGSHEVSVGASAGIAVIPDDGTEVDELLRNADTALYAAKERGRGRCTFFEHAMGSHAEQQLAKECELRRALSSGQLRPYYQPRLNTKTRAVVCHEALMRWVKPCGTVVGPEAFIDVLEQMGLMEAAGAQLMLLACKQVAELNRESGTPVKLS